jgi:hypothetical protein
MGRECTTCVQPCQISERSLQGRRALFWGRWRGIMSDWSATRKQSRDPLFELGVIVPRNGVSGNYGFPNCVAGELAANATFRAQRNDSRIDRDPLIVRLTRSTTAQLMPRRCYGRATQFSLSSRKNDDFGFGMLIMASHCLRGASALRRRRLPIRFARWHAANPALTIHRWAADVWS